jgi:hypothetical protein
VRGQMFRVMFRTDLHRPGQKYELFTAHHRPGSYGLSTVIATHPGDPQSPVSARGKAYRRNFA